MAVAYGSHSITSAENTTSVAATKPSSLALGDLQVCYLIGSEFTDITAISASTPAGWTSLGETDSGLGGDSILAAFAKIADSSDVAASTFTFAFDDTMEKITAMLVRVTTTSSFTDVTSQVVATLATDVSTGGENSISASGLVPTRSSSLLLIGAGAAEDFDIAFSTYATTNNNPTWTEGAETYHDPSGVGLNSAFAYGAYSEGTTTGDFSIAVDANGTFVMGLIAINEDVGATVTTTHLAVSPSFNSPQMIAGAAVTASHLAVSPTLTSPTLTVKNSIWSNGTRPVATVAEVNAEFMDGDNYQFMDGDNKLYTEAQDTSWSNQTRP